MDKFEKYCKLAKKWGATNAKIIKPENVIVAEWVRLKCQYGCGGYGECLTCPPHSPTPDFTRKMLKYYSRALLITYEKVKYDNEIELRTDIRENVAELERRLFLDGYYKAFGMAAGPCSICDFCDVNKSCKFPRKARPSMEACGIDVYETMHNAGFKLEVVQSQEDYCTLAGLILID
ncbi:MAG TPA: DUF2284 domain-containing protein [bacterium (Candidatus Stahlbacteria)]|nr:DUF2284 domain-containing protein [Candidatus Stahlbacteria bacterium]